MSIKTSEDTFGNSNLHLAVINNKGCDEIKEIIDAGADVNQPNSDRNTALHLCLLNTGRFSLTTFDPFAYDRASGSIVKPSEKHTITVNANLLEDYDIAKLLIDNGADLNLQNNDGNTPLHLALINSKPTKHVQELNDKRENLDKQCVECVKTCKLASKQSKMYKLVKKMIDKGADIGKQNNEGNTALHFALSSQLQLINAVYKTFKSYVNSYVDLIQFNDECRSIPYLKIVGDNFEKLLQILSENSETINITNKLGMDPIQMTLDIIKRKSGYLHLQSHLQNFSLLITFVPLYNLEYHEHFTYNDCYENTLNDMYLEEDYLQKFSLLMTIVHLLNLEYHRHFTYNDCYGNTLLHLLIENYRYRDAIILESVDPTYLKFDVQNKAGNTPLHITLTDEIVYILSNCEKVDLFATNRREETFLHTIFKFKVSFVMCIKQILQGQCQYCSKKAVKKLLICRDIAGNTPLHVFITHKFEEISHDYFLNELIQTFYEAGADLNARNVYKESILHRLVRAGASEEIIKFTVEHGADVDVQNVFGEPPIFEASRKVVKVLMDSGADLNICNKIGQNLLLSVMYKKDEFHIEYLIQKCGIRIKDINNNNILHYAAWHGINNEEYCENVNKLLDTGVEIEPDALGQLPCYIAHQMGHVNVAHKLCKCDNTEHLEKFTFTKQKRDLYENLTLKKHKFSSLRPFKNKRKYFASCPITAILEMPLIGSVNFEDEGEAGEIRSCIVNIINEICKRLGYENDLLKNRVIQSGSVGENTKVGLPNEFDFLCVFYTLSKACYVETVSKDHPDYAVVKLKDEFRGHRCQSLFDENCYFSYDT